MHLLTKFGANIFTESGDVDTFQNSRWQKPPTRIFKLNDTGILVVWYRIEALCKIWFKYLLQSQRLTHFCSWRPSDDEHELTSCFHSWSCGHLQMDVMHLSTKFVANISVQSGDYFTLVTW